MKNDNDFRRIIYHMIAMSAFERALKAFAEKQEALLKSSREGESDVHSKITDRDMLLFRIDMALDNRDEVEFDLLVQELEGMECQSLR